MVRSDMYWSAHVCDRLRIREYPANSNLKTFQFAWNRQVCMQQRSCFLAQVFRLNTRFLCYTAWMCRNFSLWFRNKTVASEIWQCRKFIIRARRAVPRIKDWDLGFDFFLTNMWGLVGAEDVSNEVFQLKFAQWQNTTASVGDQPNSQEREKFWSSTIIITQLRCLFLGWNKKNGNENWD